MHDGRGGDGISSSGHAYPAYTKMTRDDCPSTFALFATVDAVTTPVRRQSSAVPFNIRSPAVWTG